MTVAINYEIAGGGIGSTSSTSTSEVGTLPQFGAIRALADFDPYIVTADALVITGPCIVSGFRCTVVGSLTAVGVYDALTATGTNLLPLGTPVVNTEYLLAGGEGVLFDTGLYVDVTGAGGTLVVYAKAAEV